MRTAFARTVQLSRSWRRRRDGERRHSAVPRASNRIDTDRTLEDWARQGGGLIDHGQTGLSLPAYRAGPAERP